ncbi:MAG: two-component system LytT family sensor kinase [Saprospiraceae bacterium]|jgi:two-component system LytT family sensor kinase
MKGIGKKSTWFQILFWGVIWVLIPLVLMGFDNLDRALVRGIQVFIAVSIVVFINLEFLLPRLYFRKKVLWYIAGSIGLIIIVHFLLEWDGMPWSDFFDQFERKRPRNRPGVPGYWYIFKLLGEVSPYVISLFGSSLFMIANFANTKEKEMAQLKAEKLEAEMKFLKSQINPHFLFNALNNIYTLSVIKSDNTPENLLKLSAMLRYMLYDCKEDRVPLKKELEYIDNFVDLNKLKDSQGLNVELNLDRSQPNLMVAPLIFVPFIENAFKHSKIEDLENGWIKISLEVRGKSLLFKVRNSRSEDNFTKDKVGGIGLKNVKRQLELLYPDKYHLVIDKKEKEFVVSLKIDL